jgi:hypothetical protein
MRLERITGAQEQKGNNGNKMRLERITQEGKWSTHCDCKEVTETARTGYRQDEAQLACLQRGIVRITQGQEGKGSPMVLQRGYKNNREGT